MEIIKALENLNLKNLSDKELSKLRHCLALKAFQLDNEVDKRKARRKKQTSPQANQS